MFSGRFSQANKFFSTEMIPFFPSLCYSRPKILELNGLKWPDYDANKQNEILKGLLEECKATYHHEEDLVKPHKVKELTRYWYRTQTENTSSVVTSDNKQFLASADLDQSQLAKAVKDQTTVEVKVEFPKRLAFINAIKQANHAIRRLEKLQTDGARLKAQLQASLPTKLGDFSKQFGLFNEFLDKFRNSAATAEKLSKTDLDEDKSVEQEKKISEWSCQATEHLDEITLLNKRARGWLA